MVGKKSPQLLFCSYEKQCPEATSRRMCLFGLIPEGDSIKAHQKAARAGSRETTSPSPHTGREWMRSWVRIQTLKAHTSSVLTQQGHTSQRFHNLPQTVPPTVQLSDISLTNPQHSHQVHRCNRIQGIISKFDNNSIFQNSQQTKIYVLTTQDYKYLK